MKTKTLTKAEEKQQAHFDNTIITWVKMFPQNLGYAFSRASQVLNCKKSKVVYRWYTEIRHRDEVFFTLSSEYTTLVNKRMMTTKLIEELENQV